MKLFCYWPKHEGGTECVNTPSVSRSVRSFETIKHLTLEIWGFESPSLLDLGLCYICEWLAVAFTYMSPLMIVIEIGLTIGAYIVSSGRQTSVCFAVLRQLYHFYVFGIWWALMVDSFTFILLLMAIALGWRDS